MHSITAPPFLCSAGAFNRRISSPRRILFVWPAHPIVVLPRPILAGASPRRATIAYIGWRIPSPILAGASPRCATIAYLGWRIPSPILAGASPCRATIAYIGYRIPSPILAGASPRHATIDYLGWRTPSLFLAGTSPRRATIAYIGWRIPSPCPLSFFAGASPRRHHASSTYLGRCIPSLHRPIVFHFMRGNRNGFPFPRSSKIMVHLIAAPPSPISVCDLAGAIDPTAVPL